MRRARRGLARVHAMSAMRVPAIECPACGIVLDGALAIVEFGAPPRPGDVSVCFGCGAVLVFTAIPGARLMGFAEMAALPEGVAMELRQAQEIVRAHLADEHATERD